jgi:Raf kinase inhibitor-like YbhB/YbcL family protein
MLRTSLFASLIVTGIIATLVLADNFTLSSPDIVEGQQLASTHVFQGFGCQSGNVAPTLTWTGTPKGTKSYAVTVYDPDASTSSGWWHWFAFNISADVTKLTSGAAISDSVVELNNDYGATGFGRACLPPGEVHRYEFSMHALGTTLEISGTVRNALAGLMVSANSLAQPSWQSIIVKNMPPASTGGQHFLFSE